MWADFHCHTRDGKQSHKDTVKHFLEVAYAGGGIAVGAMSNPDPPLLTLDGCREYLALARDAAIPVQFYVHIGLTADVEQVKRAVEASRKEPGICGAKVFLAPSTGDRILSVAHPDDQYAVLETLTQEGYAGVLVVHCEKESEMNDDAYNPKKPKTWSTKCRPEKAEVRSFGDLVGAARSAGFQGTIHVAHVSTVDVVDYVYNHRGDDKLKLSCGITPHHAFLSNEYMKGKDGAWYKCNPPLRSPKTQKALLEKLVHGYIPIIESDHAPHSCEDKIGKRFTGKKHGKAKQQKLLPASGVASGTIWPYLYQALLNQGMSRENVHAVMRDNVIALYGLEDRIPHQSRRRDVDWDALEKLRLSYPHDPFRKLFDEGVFQPGW